MIPKTFNRVDEPSEEFVCISIPSGVPSHGTLRFAPDSGISLDLLTNANLSDVFSNDNRHYPLLTGRLIDDRYVTLIDVGTTARRGGLGGFAHTTHYANSALVGIHLHNTDAKAFTELYVELTGVNEWFGVIPIQFDWDILKKPHKERTYQLTCVPAECFESTSADGHSIVGHQAMEKSGDFHDATITNTFLLSVRVTAALSVAECQSEVFRLQAFMSLLCGRQVFVNRVSLVAIDENHQKHRCAYFAQFARPNKDPGKWRQGDPLLPLPFIRDHLPLLWSRWNEYYKYYEVAIQLFVSTEVHGGQLASFELLAIMQALETLHRNRFDGVYSSTNEFSKALSALIAAIPSCLAEDHRHALRKRLEYGNEYSLRKRLLDLADRLPGGSRGELGRLIHPNLRRFLETCVSTRNYLTHYSADSKKESFCDTRLVLATRLLRWFFAASLLSDLGLPEGPLTQAFANSRNLRQLREAME